MFGKQEVSIKQGLIPNPKEDMVNNVYDVTKAKDNDKDSFEENAKAIIPLIKCSNKKLHSIILFQSLEIYGYRVAYNQMLYCKHSSN